MKFTKVKSFDDILGVTFAISKFSGYVFFSVDISSQNVAVFSRNMSDYLIFVISIAFSIASFYASLNYKAFSGLNSVILSMGASLLTRAGFVVVVLCKILNFCTARSFFDLTAKLRGIDGKVSFLPSVTLLT